jgi:hypothetical protein
MRNTEKVHRSTAPNLLVQFPLAELTLQLTVDPSKSRRSIPARADGRSQQEPMVDHNNLMDDDTPKTIVKAFVSPNADDWKEAIRSEMDSILFNGI